VVVVASHPSVDWGQYFTSIRTECPWALAAWSQGLIDIVNYTGEILPLGKYHARVYMVNAPTETVEALCQGLDHGEDAWLFSYPGYGAWATPMPVLIQQDRQRLQSLRSQLESKQSR
jgi:hypothetical protein